MVSIIKRNQHHHGISVGLQVEMKFSKSNFTEMKPVFFLINKSPFLGSKLISVMKITISHICKMTRSSSSSDCNKSIYNHKKGNDEEKRIFKKYTKIKNIWDAKLNKFFLIRR